MAVGFPSLFVQCPVTVGLWVVCCPGAAHTHFLVYVNRRRIPPLPIKPVALWRWIAPARVHDASAIIPPFLPSAREFEPAWLPVTGRVAADCRLPATLRPLGCRLPGPLDCRLPKGPIGHGQREKHGTARRIAKSQYLVPTCWMNLIEST